MTDLQYLIEHAIPEGRQSLENGYTNLERIAAYCEANYIQTSDKKAALEETKRLTVQSLASVAYQVNALASNVLAMLDLQTQRVYDMETQLTNIAQIVDIHKEKVARREIGVLTTNKTNVKQHKIIAPAHQEKTRTYIRRHIDYSILDDLGHGVRISAPSQQNSRLVSRATSSVSSGSGQPVIQSQEIYNASQNANLSCFGASIKSGTISRSTNKEYRIPVTVAPPTAPMISAEYVQQRYPGMVQQGLPQQSESLRSTRPSIDLSGVTNFSANSKTCATLLTASQMQQSQQQYGIMGTNPNNQYLQMKSVTEDFPIYSSNANNNNNSNLNFAQEHSPPLPPPPPTDDEDNVDRYVASRTAVEDDSSDHVNRREGATNSYNLDNDSYKEDSNSSGQPVWVPQNYMEKVIALYDYQAEKSDELSFYENQVIYVLKKNEDGWFEGVLNGVTGLFPGNYVEPTI